MEAIPDTSDVEPFRYSPKDRERILAKIWAKRGAKRNGEGGPPQVRPLDKLDSEDYDT